MQPEVRVVAEVHGGHHGGGVLGVTEPQGVTDLMHCDLLEVDVCKI
jgi:hypothetical protein